MRKDLMLFLREVVEEGDEALVSQINV